MALEDVMLKNERVDARLVNATGVPVSAAAPLAVSLNAAADINIGDVELIGDDGAVIAGSKSDTVWDGLAASPTWTALYKYIAAKIEATRALLVLGTAVGGTASGSAIANAPVTIGGRTATTNPTAKADGQVNDIMLSKTGKVIAVGALREMKSRQVTTITSSTAETTIITADATFFLDIFLLLITNTSGTASTVTIKDSTAGTTVWTFAVPAGTTVGFVIDPGGAGKQTTVNNNWTATCGTSVASILITAHFVKNL